jgi:hypothetical protein
MNNAIGDQFNFNVDYILKYVDNIGDERTYFLLAARTIFTDNSPLIDMIICTLELTMQSAQH